MKTQRPVVLLLFFFYSTALFCVQQFPDIRLLESNQNRLIIEITPNFKTILRNVKINSEFFDQLDFQNSVSASFIKYKDRIGKPDIRCRNILLGMPGLNNNKVEILSAEYEIIGSINLPPVPKYLKSGDSLASKKIYEKDPKIYGKNAFFPESIVSLQKPGIARDQILANLVVFPYQYNPYTKEVKKYKKLIIKIEFGKQNPKNILYSSIQSSIQNEPLRSSIINYDQAKNWKVKETSTLIPSLSSIKNSVLANGEWHKLEVDDEGIYKLDASFFTKAGINLKSVNPKTIKIYGNGGMEVPEDLTQLRPSDLLECAIFVSDETVNEFKEGNFVLFFGKGAKGWTYNPSDRKFSHYQHHYSNSNYYFLTFGGANGKRMKVENSISGGNVLIPTNLMNKYFIEPEITNFLGSGREWFGEELSSGYKLNINYTTPALDGIIPDTAVTYRIQCVGRDKSPSSFDLSQNNELLGNIYVYGTVDYSGETGYTAMKSDIFEFSKKTNISNNRFSFNLKFNPGDLAALGCLDWLEVFYYRSLSTNNDEIYFTTPDTNCTVEYRLAGYQTSNIFVFNVQEHNDVSILTGAEIFGGNIKFRVEALPGTAIPYYVTGNNGFKVITNVQKIVNGNLHGISTGAELIVVTHKDLWSEAARYKSYRENNTLNGLKTVLVDVDSIYNEFSGGLLDPTAIRDFVRYAFNNWQVKPKYLLLFGDGSFSYKGNYIENKVPPYETNESLLQESSYCCDDFYVRIIGDDDRNDLAVGRITARTMDEAKICVDKIISYESANSLGSWRNTLTFVADDGYSGSNGYEGTIYTDHTEYIAENLCPKNFDKKKIYEVAYPLVYSVIGAIRPDVNTAINDQINSGTLIISYIGHSNTDLWAHEHIFVTAEALPKMHNVNKYLFFISASCTFGYFDKLGGLGSAELLLSARESGAIGVFSACRTVDDPDNYDLDLCLFQNMFSCDESGLLYRIGDVILPVKQYLTGDNTNKFQLLCDPTIRLSVPRYSANIDSINGKTCIDSIQLKAMSKVIMKGRVLNNKKSIMNDFNGKVSIVINDASKNLSVSDGISSFNFVQQGGVIYKGEGTVKNGEFLSMFYIPKDISYMNNYGKISLYFQNDEYDGAGVNTNIIIGGSDTSNVVDCAGPVMNVYLNDRNFHDGDLVDENPKLIVDLFDESGINTSNGVGHTLEAWLDTNSEYPTRIDLIDNYQGKTDSYQEGTAECALEKLSNGMHNLTVKAFDVFNNMSSKKVSFKVSEGSNLTLMNVLNYPNPFNKNTKFTFQQTQTDPIDVKIKIYTVAGRLIKTLDERGINGHFVQIEWDGRDNDGDKIANGVYLYKVLVRTQDGKQTNEALGKLSVLR